MEGNRIIDRLDAYMKEKGYSDTFVQSECGLSNGTLNKSRAEDRDLSRRAAELILKKFQDLDRVWLLTGRKDEVPPQPPDGDTIIIPVVNLDSRGGTSFNEEVQTAAYITGQMPFSTQVAQQGDVVIPVYGDSMEPNYRSGSLVLIRKVELWREYLELGCVYILALEDDRRLIKTVKAGSDKEHLLLVSANPGFEPTEIPKRIIRDVWRVIVTVRRESL